MCYFSGLGFGALGVVSALRKVYVKRVTKIYHCNVACVLGLRFRLEFRVLVRVGT